LESTSSSFLERAGRWFLESGIQEPCGGLARYYRWDLRANARVSTEITGYGISTLLWLHSSTNESKYLEAALRAGRFLTRVAWDRASESFPFEFAVDGDCPAALAYFFDAGIIVRGLLALWRATRQREFLDAALAGGESMARDFAAEGEFHPIVSLPAKQPLQREPRWSRSPGCYQLKSALAWFELCEATGRPEFRLRYQRLLDYALTTHTSFLPGDPQPERVMDRLHAYCYFLEGLLPCADLPACSEALVAGIQRVDNLSRAITPLFERSDVYAQLLRLRFFASQLGALPLEGDRAGQEAELVAGFQLDDQERRLWGGFGFGRKGSQLLPFVNPASTAFCAQALHLWRLHQQGSPLPAWRTLI